MDTGSGGKLGFLIRAREDFEELFEVLTSSGSEDGIGSVIL